MASDACPARARAPALTRLDPLATRHEVRRELHRSPFFTVDELPGKVALVVRLARPFASPAEVETACAPVQRALDALGRGDHCLLLDTRDARGSNHPDYESWFAAHRVRLLQGFRKVAVVVRTAVGKLHSERLMTRDGNRDQAVLFQDLTAARNYLLRDED